MKQIPAATGHGYDINQIVAVPFDFTPTGAPRQTDLSVKLGSSPEDPIAGLPIGEITFQRYGRTQLKVGYGQYLGIPTSMPSGQHLLLP